MYNYKVYNKSGILKFVISSNKIKNDVSFSANINGGQGQIRLILKENFSYNSIVNSDLIKIYKESTLIYTGIVQNIIRNITDSYEDVEYPILGLGTILNYLLFISGGSYIFTKNQDPSQTAKDIIDYINTIYPSILNYDPSSIDTYGSIISIDFSNTSCFEALKKTAIAIGYRFFIDNDGKVYFKQKSNTVNKILTVGKNIEKITIEENTENLVNKLRVEYTGGLYNPYEDLTSQSTYGLHETYQNQSSLDLAGANSFGNSYISTYKNPIKKTKILLNKNYNIESIKIGDVVKVNNFAYSISGLQVVSYNYFGDKLELGLENQSFLGNEIKNLIS